MKKKRRLKPKIRMLLTFAVAIVLFGYVSFSVINYGFSKNKYEAETKNLEEKLHKLKDEETDLNQEISKLKDDDYLARYAREEYLYSKKGEYVIKLEDDTKNDENIKSNGNEKPNYKMVFIIVGIIIALAFLILIIKTLINSKKKKVIEK